jgi:glycolate oxidase FAD binding subunit
MGDVASILEPELFVDGVLPDRTEYPGTPEEVAGLLRQSAERDEGVFPIGSGLHQGVGLFPEPIDIGLSMGRLTSVLRYDPEDLVLSVEAGMTLADVQAVLAGHGQRLPVEAPGGDGATIGGLLALGLNGPRQLGSPTLRDLLLGMTVALTDGTVAKSGGMVVKNVTGFDMGRLHVGARGTLGVITSANFKVLPRPETEATVIAAFGDPAAGPSPAFAAFDRLRSSTLRPVAGDVVVEEGITRLAVRFEGRGGAVERQIRAAAHLLGSGTEMIAAPNASRSWWERHVERLGFADSCQTVLRFDARPRAIADRACQVAAGLGRQGIEKWRLVCSPGLGTLWLHLGSTDQEPVIGLVAGLSSLGGALTVLSGPPTLKGRLWSVAVGEPRPIDSALRQQFDPNQILNRGRFPR